jgi:DNA modification methylase
MLQKLINEYAKTRLPLTVHFRKLVGCLSSPERATHLIHSYPAKILMHIPFFFLANNILSRPGETLLDPFTGSGTVLLESLLSGRNGLGVECNPLARLIAKVKTTPLNATSIQRFRNDLFTSIAPEPQLPIPDVVNIKHWFYPHVIDQLQCLLESIQLISDVHVRDFFLVCFSQCVRKVSLADPRLNTPVRLKEEYPLDHHMRERAEKRLSFLRGVVVTEVFDEILTANTRRVTSLNSLPSSMPSIDIICPDAKCLNFEFTVQNGKESSLPPESVQLIITSPPYPGSQKYIRCSSLSLGWIGLCHPNELAGLKSQVIGREEFNKSECSIPVKTGIEDADKFLSEIWQVNPIRATIAGKYLTEMRTALSEMYRVLRPDGYLVLVAANNHVCKREFRTLIYLRQMAELIGFSTILELFDHIRSRGLMTKRNHTASMITSEGILVLRKGG